MIPSFSLLILAVTGIITYLTLRDKERFAQLEYTPYLVHHSKEWHRMVTHAFLHADWVHFGMNMYMLFLFGPKVEEELAKEFGSVSLLLYLFLYLGGILFSALPGYIKHRNNFNYRAVGASGAVSSVVFTSIILFPLDEYMLFFAIELPAFALGILYLVYEIYQDKRSNDNIAHDAHYWGALFGIAFPIAIRPTWAIEFIEKLF